MDIIPIEALPYLQAISAHKQGMNISLERTRRMLEDCKVKHPPPVFDFRDSALENAGLRKAIAESEKKYQETSEYMEKIDKEISGLLERLNDYKEKNTKLGIDLACAEDGKRQLKSELQKKNNQMSEMEQSCQRKIDYEKSAKERTQSSLDQARREISSLENMLNESAKNSKQQIAKIESEKNAALTELHRVSAAFEKYKEEEPIRKAAEYVSDGKNQIINENYDAAIAMFKKAITLNPKHGWAHMELAKACMHKENNKAAVIWAERGIQHCRDSAWAHYWLGLAYQRNDQPAEAMAEYKTVLKIDPDFAPARKKLMNAHERYMHGKNKRETYDYTGAIACLRDAISQDPGHGWAHIELARSYMEINDPKSAIWYAKQAKKLLPDSEWPNHWLAIAENKDKRNKE